MSGVNKVILIGNLGSDPEVRYLPDGTSVANVNIATNEVRRQGDERVEHTEWHRLVFFGRQAEIVAEYLHKGSQIYVEGSLRTKKWETKEGQQRTTTEVRVFQMTMLGSRGEGGPPRDNPPQRSRPEPKPKRDAEPDAEPSRPAESPEGDPYTGDGDDIPF